MKPQSNDQEPADTQLVASPIGLIDPNDFNNQSGRNDGPFAIEDGDDDSDEDGTTEEIDDEPVDEDGDPTGEHDHHQDDNYALGGHVTRSGGV